MVGLLGLDDDHRNFHFFTERGWRHTLELAYVYGWKPSGRGAPQLKGRVASDSCEGWDWPEETFFERYPQVTPEEARAIAEALESALSDLPRYDCLDDHVQCWDYQLEENIPLTEWHAGRGRDSLRAFIGFCLEGGFEI